MACYFGIQDWFHRDVANLSGGQKQLLNLASIMAMQPKVLILDEPTSQLDPIAASDFLQTVYRINRDLGTTVIISEHRLEELFPMADRVMVMDQGRVLAFDSPERIGSFLSGGEGGQKVSGGALSRHPMFYGLPSVTRIFADACPGDDNPLTIREGRLKLAHLLEGKDVRPGSVTDPAEKTPAAMPLTEKPLKGKSPAAMPLKGKSLKENSQAGEIVIQVRDLWFRYNRDSGDVLRGLNLKVERNQLYCLLGGNGTGKSTTLKIIAGILKGQRGTVTADRDKLSMLPQNPQALFTEITAEEELMEALYYVKLPVEEKLRRVEVCWP